MATFPRKRTWYCEHCNQDVSHRVYKRHKEQYYNFNGQTWIKRKPKQFDDEDHDDIMLSDVIDSAGEYQQPGLCTETIFTHVVAS